MGFLDAFARVGAPGDVADGGSRHSYDLASYGRLFKPYAHVGECAGCEVLGEISLQDRPRHRLSDANRGGPFGRSGCGLSSPRFVQLDKDRGFPALDAEGADHALRGCEDLSLQPVRSHEGLAT